jgi:hypothetical protein
MALIGGACERKAHVTAMKNRLDDPQQFMPMGIRDMIALPRFPRAYTPTSASSWTPCAGVSVRNCPTAGTSRVTRTAAGDGRGGGEKHYE